MTGCPSSLVFSQYHILSLLLFISNGDRCTQKTENIFTGPCVPTACLMSPLRVTSQNKRGKADSFYYCLLWAVTSWWERAHISNSDLTKDTLNTPDHVQRQHKCL